MATRRDPDLIANEKSSARLTFTIKGLDDAATPVPNTSLSSMTMTLRDKDNTVINSREDVDMTSYVDGSGVFDFTFVPADMVLSDETHDYEDLEAEFTIVKSGDNPFTLIRPIIIRVRNLTNVSST